MSAGTGSRTRELARTGLRGVGLLMLWLGGTILLYVAWLLWFTGVETARAQDDLLATFDGFEQPAVDGGDDPTVVEPDDAPTVAADEPVEVGDGVAVLQFERPGTDARPVLEDPVVVVAGTSMTVLRDGPGHYTETADPGEPGNFAVAGHRTTYGQPFHDLDQVAPGDLVHVTTRDGSRHTYEVLDGSSGGAAPGQHIVSPRDVWVIGPDPLGDGGSMLTLTTCHPRYSAAQRLVVFAQLVDSVPA